MLKAKKQSFFNGLNRITRREQNETAGRNGLEETIAAKTPTSEAKGIIVPE